LFDLLSFGSGDRDGGSWRVQSAEWSRASRRQQATYLLTAATRPSRRFSCGRLRGRLERLLTSVEKPSQSSSLLSLPLFPLRLCRAVPTPRQFLIAVASPADSQHLKQRHGLLHPPDLTAPPPVQGKGPRPIFATVTTMAAELKLSAARLSIVVSLPPGACAMSARAPWCSCARSPAVATVASMCVWPRLAPPL
jgi:hypothetical protein